MTATLNRPPSSRSKLRPPVARRVPITVKPSVEEREQLKRDRISTVVAVLMIMGLIGLLAWAAMSGDPSAADAMWDVPYLY